MFDEPDEVLAQVQEDVRRAQRRAENLGRLQSAVAAVRGVARSDQRDIEVEVDSTGRLVRLEISDEAVERGGRRISAEVMTLMQTAQRQARARSLEAASGLLGDDDPMLGTLRAQAEAEGETAQEGLVWRD